MHVAPDLGPRADRGPRIHHRPTPNVGPDVHVARHNDDARLDESPVPHGPRRHDTHTRGRQILLRWDLVAVLERTYLKRPHLRNGEVQIDSLHHPRVGPPLALTLLCDTQLSLVQGGDGIKDRRAVILRFEQSPVLERGLYPLLYPHPPPTPRDLDKSASLAARSSLRLPLSARRRVGTLSAPQLVSSCMRRSFLTG